MSLIQLTTKERAVKTGTVMIENDINFQRLGASLENIDEGFALVRLEINHTHLNGHGLCHGGVIFTLADATFGFACNSYNIKAVAQNCNITYISPAKETDILFSEAKEIEKYGRSAIYDVKIINSRENLVAIFRGHSREIGQKIFQES